eukprot:m.35419 g.35419  ORF g.35419 m.35419 type:complete len:51 (-) comp9595_c1_seq1:231-383(-)
MYVCVCVFAYECVFMCVCDRFFFYLPVSLSPCLLGCSSCDHVSLAPTIVW